VTQPTSALSRRATLAAAAAPLALLLAGCSRSEARAKLDSGVDKLEAPRSTPPAPANPDQALVDQAVSAIADVRATLRPHREQDAAIADLVALHSAHLKALAAPSATGTAAQLGAGPLLTQVAAREKALGALLAAKAGTAHAGDLARLFASMSAAVAQRTAGALA
jgi:hypothetical protein